MLEDVLLWEASVLVPLSLLLGIVVVDEGPDESVGELSGTI